MERWDLFDENRKPLFYTHNKGDKLLPGTYHVVVGVWVLNSKCELLITLRSNLKDKYPGLWENTYGSLLAGENSKQGAVRELYEETGIYTTESQLIFCCTIKSKTSFVDMYMLNYDIPINKLKMQKGETVDARWVTFEDFEKMFSLNLVSPLAIERYYLVKNMILNYMASDINM